MESIYSFSKLHSGRHFIGREEVSLFTLDKDFYLRYTIHMDLTCTLDTREWRLISACMGVVIEAQLSIAPDLNLIKKKVREQFEPQVRRKKEVKLRRIHARQADEG